MGLTYPLCLNGLNTKNIYTEIGFGNDFSVIIDQSGIIRYKGAGVYMPLISSWLDNLLLTLVDENTAQVPENIQLEQNYPNPFNPVTTIKFQIPNSQYVRLEIFDIKGKLIRKLIDNEMNAGSHELFWDGRDVKGNHVHSGVYFYTLRSGRDYITKKMTMLR